MLDVLRPPLPRLSGAVKSYRKRSKTENPKAHVAATFRRSHVGPCTQSGLRAGACSNPHIAAAFCGIAAMKIMLVTKVSPHGIFIPLNVATSRARCPCILLAILLQGFHAEHLFPTLQTDP